MNVLMFVENSIAPFLFMTIIFTVIIVTKNITRQLKGLKVNYLLDFTVAIFIAYLIVVFSLTLVSSGPVNPLYARTLSLIPFYDIIDALFITKATTNPFYTMTVFFSNILLFIPFGFLTSIYLYIKEKLTFKKIVLYGFLTTLFIETSQYVFALGRVSSMDDLINNTVGVIIGFCIASLFIKIYEHNFKQIS